MEKDAPGRVRPVQTVVSSAANGRLDVRRRKVQRDRLVARHNHHVEVRAAFHRVPGIEQHG